MLKFKRLIDKYSVTFEIVYSTDKSQKEITIHDYDDLGRYIGNKSSTPKPIYEIGTISPVSQREVYESGGSLTESDRILFSLNHNIPLKSVITYKNQNYHVQSKNDYEQFADFAQYTLKAVSGID
jgi:hypothetical protein